MSLCSDMCVEGPFVPVASGRAGSVEGAIRGARSLNDSTATNILHVAADALQSDIIKNVTKIFE